MRYLLDTHALLWWLGDDPRLGPTARDAVGAPGSDVLVSVVSLWEVIVKMRVGKLRTDLDTVLDVGGQGFGALGVSEEHLRALATLPVHHRDPFDHLLIAQAIVEDATFISADVHVPAYPVRHLPCA